MARMNTRTHSSPRAWVCAVAAAASFGCCFTALAASAPTLANYPLFLAPAVTPNVLVLFDNSGSMDATMAGKVVSGEDPNTRSNIARNVLRNIIDDNRTTFNWGLGTFELSDAPALYKTQAYFLGSNATMVYTNNCTVPPGSDPDVTGYSADGPQVPVISPDSTVTVFKDNCVQNPDVDAAGNPRNGQRFLTFERSGDDADINDVFYQSSLVPYSFGLGLLDTPTRPNRYNIFSRRSATTTWTSADFNVNDCVPGYCPVEFTPTDAGFLPVAAALPRILFIRRGWGYGNGITGRGRMVEPVVSSSTQTAAQTAAEAAHYNSLMAALAPETNLPTTEIKNGAFSTPLAGTLRSARQYFAGDFPGALRSPVNQVCQKNYVVLATDGNPTGRTDGSQYNPADWINQRDSSGAWVYGQAQKDVFEQIGVFSANGTPTSGLRSTRLTGANLSNGSLANRTFDIQTYVIGLGDSVVNESSVAALNEMARLGGGAPQAFLGSSSDAVQTAFQAIVSSIQRKQGSSAAVAINSSFLTTGTVLYQTTFNSQDWTGDLKAYSLNTNGQLAVNPSWSAAQQLAAQDWNTGRAIVTARPGAASGQRGIPLRWPANPATPTANELSTAQVANLNTSPAGVTDALGELRLRFLRGDRSRESANCATCTPRFRDRSTPLGDLINSAAVLVGAPSATFYDDIESVSYRSFVAAQRNRQKVLYVGGNDGMLHAFDATTGRELLGYVPSPVFPNLSKLTSTGYSHFYYADGTPSVGDAFYDGRWRSLLVAGMRAGGKGLYALDVTDPGSFGESNAGAIVRWEFLNSQDADMGHVFSQPVIVKTNNGRWSVIVANGYNASVGNAASSGRAVLFVLDAETGAVVRKIDTGAGSATSPNGLSGPVVIDTNDDGVADLVYAGDLNGNLWKFDLSSASAGSWGVGNGGAALYNTDAANPTGGARAITGRPNVTAFPRGGYMVVFGSGSYLSTADGSSSGTQALYGVWDKPATTGTVPQASLVQQTVVTTANGSDGVSYRLSTHAVDNPTDTIATGDAALTLSDYYSTKRGWFLNLPTSGERSVTDPRIRGGRAIFTTLIPNVSDPCSYGGNGWLMELDVFTGNRDDAGTFDTNGSGTVDAADNIRFGGSGASSGSGRYFEGGIPVGTTIIANQPAGGGESGGGPIEDAKKSCTEIVYVPQSNGSTTPVTQSCKNPNAGRAMWREVK